MAFFALALAPYAFLAARSHFVRFALLCFLRHSFNATASFSARTWAAVFGFGRGGGAGPALPGPENVAEAGAPNTSGWGVGAERQLSVLVHAGGTLTAVEGHGSAVEQTWAS